MPSALVPGFLPSTHGFRFSNWWSPGPTVTFGPFDPRILFGIGDAKHGLCGGMALSVKDLFEATPQIPVPTDDREFPNRSPRFMQIVRRQVQSLQWGVVPLRYFDLAAFRPDPPVGLPKLLRREPPRVQTITREWPKIRASLDAGRLAVVGVIKHASANPLELSKNHQTLAYGYTETGGRIRLRIYDPNYPLDDTVELRATIAADVDRPWRDRIELSQSNEPVLLGFFLHPYPAPGSLAVWR